MRPDDSHHGFGLPSPELRLGAAIIAWTFSTTALHHSSSLSNLKEFTL